MLLLPEHLLVVLVAHYRVSRRLLCVCHCFHRELGRFHVAEDYRLDLVYGVAVGPAIVLPLPRPRVGFFVEPGQSLVLVDEPVAQIGLVMLVRHLDCALNSDRTSLVRVTHDQSWLRAPRGESLLFGVLGCDVGVLLFFSSLHLRSLLIAVLPLLALGSALGPRSAALRLWRCLHGLTVRDFCGGDPLSSHVVVLYLLLSDHVPHGPGAHAVG